MGRRSVLAIVCALAAGGGLTAAPGSRASGAGQEGGLNSGIEGHVEIRPVQSVERPGIPNSAPYQATVTVLDAQGKTVTTVISDAQGDFRVALPPGTYVLRPESPTRYPRASTRSVVVTPRTFSRVDIVYDSGRR